MKIVSALFIGVAAVLLLSGYWSQAAPIQKGVEMQGTGSSAVLEPLGASIVFHSTYPKNNYNYSATLYLQNISDQESAVMLDFKNAQGTVSVDKTVPARGTLVLPAGMVPGLDDGEYSLVVTSQQPVESVVEIYNSVDDKLASYRGVPSSDASTILYFSPFFDGSGLQIFNGSNTSAEFQIDFFAGDGSYFTYGPNTVLSQETYYIYGPTIPGLPNGTYLAKVTASQPVTGILYHNNLAGDIGGYEIRGSLNPGPKQYLPRAMKSYLEGGITRTTQLMVSNLGSATDVTLYYTNPTAGTFQQQISLQAGGSQFIDLASVSILPAGTVWAIIAESSPGYITLSEYTPTGAQTTSDYEGSVSGWDQELYLPRLAGASDEFTVASLQNVSNLAASTVISYYDLSGTLVYSQSLNMNPGEVRRDNHSQMAGLGTGFAGSAVVATNQYLVGWVDVYVGSTACQAVSNVQINRSPTDELYSGDTVLFSASADGTTPFTYSWTLDGTAVGGNESSYEHTFNDSGTYAVGVTVSNDCGQSGQSLTLEIKEGTGDRPDLSTSYKAVSLKTVDTGDLLTYTLVLRNTSAFTANATLTDTLPTEVSYMPGTASASDGNTVMYSNGELIWSGEIISGTPVMIEFAAQVQSGTIGTSITNTAELDDGLGRITNLESASIYNPGYSLSIAEGALFTDVPTVTLRFSWNADDNISDVKISNDGGFGEQGNTTDWIPVDSTDPTYPDWVLSTYNDQLLPRTVYIKFRDASGTPYGPFQDDIIYDPIPPQVSSVEIIPLSGVGLQAKGSVNVIVRVTSSDDNSGVAQVHISNDGDFNEFSSHPVTGSVTDFIWELQSSGMVYVRVVDRSGNLSEVTSEQGPTSDLEIYLPLALGG
jgi:uncharacterized repeat protein (TIGR01451 family)